MSETILLDYFFKNVSRISTELKDAPCAAVGPGPWDADNFSTQEAKTAQKICYDCHLRFYCLKEALAFENGKANSLKSGIWGGLCPEERTTLIKESATLKESIINGNVN